MFLDPIRIVLLLNLIFIQILWTLTTRGSNVTGFFKTFLTPRSIAIGAFELFLLVQALLPIDTSISLGNWNGFVEIIGITLAIGGTAFASWAKIVMGKSWGRPAQHDAETQSTLVTKGPFQWSRNPIYVGLFILFVGQQIALRSYCILLVPLFYLVIRKAVSIEEKLLIHHFGNTYSAYQSLVPRFF